MLLAIFSICVILNHKHNKSGDDYMFLTKKALKKIKLLVGVYCGLGAFCLIMSIVFVCLNMEIKFLIILGVLALFLGFVFNKFGRYAEGKGKLLNLGNKLVLHQLRPAEFVRLYEQARDCPDNVVSEPDFDVLKMLVTAYDAMGEVDLMLEVIEQMLSSFDGSKQAQAKLLKSSVLFDMGKIEEAEKLYSEVLNSKMDFITKSILDDVMKTERAIALEDFTTAEAKLKASLEIPRYNKIPLMTLYLRMDLGKVYCKTNRFDEAKDCLKYCIENSGETNIKSSAENMMREYNLI